MPLIDLTGQRFGRLLVVSRADPKRTDARWHCVCDCGATVTVYAFHLKSGHTTSCGCSWQHGHAETRTYKAWENMKQRCLNQRHPAWPDYGARGITVCARWMDFRNFLADMGEVPPSLSLERVDNDSGYGPDNCTWATRLQQNRNRRPRRQPQLSVAA
jgi:hypothetical protein